MNKEVIKIIIKVLFYALGLIGTYFGVSAMTSCTVQRQFDSSGKGTIILSDTTHISHSGSWLPAAGAYAFGNLPKVCVLLKRLKVSISKMTL